jgi:hypothetical protein
MLKVQLRSEVWTDVQTLQGNGFPWSLQYGLQALSQP